jgi:hypothetical protein
MPEIVTLENSAHSTDSSSRPSRSAGVAVCNECSSRDTMLAQSACVESSNFVNVAR